jgi:hypothetical protein
LSLIIADVVIQVSFLPSQEILPWSLSPELVTVAICPFGVPAPVEYPFFPYRQCQTVYPRPSGSGQVISAWVPATILIPQS